VNQVRRFRNWVSHGKRGPEPASVTPNVAFDRLKRCLILLFPPIPDSWVAMGAYYVWEEASRPGAKDAIHWHKAKIHLQELIRTGQIRLPS